MVPVGQVFLLNLHPPLPGHVRYTLRCLVAVPQDTDCVTTIKSTEEKLANKKKELETFQVVHVLKVWDQNYFLFYTYFFLQSEFCEIKKKYDAARERLENDVKEITELIQVCYLTSSVRVNWSIFMLILLQEREGAYTDYQDASALKYSHVPSASRFAFSQKSRIVRGQISLV